MQKRIVAMTLLIVGLLNTVSAESEQAATNEQASAIERAAYLDPELKKQLALAKTLKEHEVVWLDVSYPEITEAQKTLAIAHPSLIAEEQGAILLIHDKEQHADWPQIIRPLRQILPESGWHTLSVSLPDETRIELPKRGLAAKGFDQVTMSEGLKKNLDSGRRKQDDSASNDKNTSSAKEPVKNEAENNAVESSPESEESVDIDLAAAKKQDQNKIPYNVRALAHIEKALEYLRSENYQNIVLIAHRRSTELMLDYIKAHQSELTSRGFAFVFIDPLMKESYLLNLKEWLGESFSAPILEIINRSNTNAADYAKSRDLAMQKAKVKTFRQVFLTVSNTEVFNESLSRRVKLWLEKNAPGEKINSQ